MHVRLEESSKNKAFKIQRMKRVKCRCFCCRRGQRREPGGVNWAVSAYGIIAVAPTSGHPPSTAFSSVCHDPWLAWLLVHWPTALATLPTAYEIQDESSGLEM